MIQYFRCCYGYYVYSKGCTQNKFLNIMKSFSSCMLFLACQTLAHHNTALWITFGKTESQRRKMKKFKNNLNSMHSSTNEKIDRASERQVAAKWEKKRRVVSFNHISLATTIHNSALFFRSFFTDVFFSFVIVLIYCCSSCYNYIVKSFQLHGSWYFFFSLFIVWCVWNHVTKQQLVDGFADSKEQRRP